MIEVRSALHIVLVVIAFIALFSFFVFFMSIRPSRFYSDNTPSTSGLKYENVTLKTSDGLKLSGWFIPNNRSKKALIIGHGYPFSKENVLSFADFLAEHYNLLFFDFRYFGESEGSYTSVGYHEKKDIEAAVKFLKKRGFDKIGGLGISLSASTLITVESKDIKAIVADSPYADLDEMIKQSYFIFPGFLKQPFVYCTKLFSWLFLGMNTNDVSVIESINRIDAPVLLIHGDKDSQINVRNSKMIYENADKDRVSLWIIPGADHLQGHYMLGKEYEKRVLDFFKKNLK